MFIQRADSLTLTSRLDPSFYSPKGLKANAKILNCGNSYPLKELVDSNRKITNGVRGPELTDSPYKLVRLQDCNQWFVELDKCLTISEEQFNENRRCLLKKNDIVVAIGGYVGNASIVKNDTTVVIGQHSAMLSSNPALFDSYYLLAYLNTYIAEDTFQRYVSGTVQAGINLEDLREIPVPLPKSMIAQIYIGNKVRQAELLREWANNIDVKIQGYHQAFIPSQINLDFEKKTRLVSTRQMTERMDAHFYPGVVDTYLNQNLGYFEKLSSCCTSIFNGQSQPKIGLDGCEQITVANLSPNYINGQLRYVEKPSNKDKFTEKGDLLMCNAAHQKSYIGKDITFVHTDKALLPSTEVMVIRADTSKVPASYLRTYFLSKLGFVQIQSTIRGITAHSYPVDMTKLDIFIPSLEGKELTDWLGTDDFLVKAGIASEFSTQLTTSAKLIVEALIEGTVTEAELIAAQQALENNDDSKDKTILSKLTDKGYAVKEGKPLFSDLDALYELLDEAQQDKDQD